MAFKPAPHGGVLVGGIIVGDQVDFERRRGIARSILSRNRTNSWWRWRLEHCPRTLDVERGEQGRRAGYNHACASPHGRRSAAVGALQIWLFSSTDRAWSGGLIYSPTTSRTWSGPTIGGRPERGRSRSKPSTPSATNRSRQTARLDLPT